MKRNGASQVIAAAMALLLGSGVAMAAVEIDFESPTYVPGPLAGQDNWFVGVDTDGADPPGPSDGTAIVTDVGAGGNGPTLPGSQVVVFTTPTDAGELRIDTMLADVVANEGPFVTFQYDAKWASSGTTATYFGVRLLDSVSGGGFQAAHWWGYALQMYAAANPDGTEVGWRGHLDGQQGGIPDGDTDWHTIRWVAYYGTETGADYGQVLYVEQDGERFYRYDTYLPENATMADWLYIRGLGIDAADVWHVDNIVISGSALPSDVPVADAGDDQIGVPLTYDGGVVTLDASGSTDDGEIVRYRWLDLDEPDYYSRTIRNTTRPEITLALPSGIHNIRLEVVDDTGLQAYDDVVVQVDISLTPVPVDDVSTPFGIEDGDIHGTAQSPYVLPKGALAFEVVTQVTGGAFGATADGHGQPVFDPLGNIYRQTWYDKIVKVSPDFDLIWESEQLNGDVGEMEFGMVVGKRHLYHLTHQDIGGGTLAPVLRAYDKTDGSPVWGQVLQIGGTTALPMERPLMALYNNKMYIVGPPYDTNADVLNDTARIWRVDCGTDMPGPPTPTLDWVVEIPWGSEIPRDGNLCIVSLDDATNQVVLIMSGRSAAPDDGLNDVAIAEVDNAGLIDARGVDGVLADASYVIYSETTGRAYVRSQNDAWGEYGLWSIDPLTTNGFGIPAGDDANPRWDQEAMALSFDGETVHSAGADGAIYSYKDGASVGRYYPFWEGWAGENAIVMRQETDTPGEYGEILVTTYPAIVDFETGEVTQNATVVAFDLANDPIGTNGAPMASIELPADPIEDPDPNIDYIAFLDAEYLTANDKGDIYVVQYRRFDRRWTRLRLTAAGFEYPECDPPSTAACPNMDVNCDNQVNGFDIADVRNTANWNVAPEAAANARADTNRDGAINGFDIADIRNTACWNQ